MIWQALVKLAILGTDRGHLPPAVLRNLQQQGLDTEQPLAKLLLQAAAFHNQLRKTTVAKSVLQTPIPTAPAEEALACSAASSRHLQLILSGKFELALPEFIQLLVAHRQCLPPESLPKLIDEGLVNPSLWRALRPAIGQRGEWLLTLNPDWQSLTTSADPSRWEIGLLAERLAILHHLRATDPPAAIPLLEKTWSTERYEHKVAFLQTLYTALSPTDEAFLEARLDDSRKEVRLQAADLLASLPQSALAQRLLQAILPYLRLDKNQTLQLSLPDELPQETVRDGILPGKRGKLQGGLKADWLRQLFERIAPQQWNQHFGKDATFLLAAMQRSNWATTFLPALIVSINRHQDRQWAKAMVELWLARNTATDWSHPDSLQLLKLLSPEDFNRMAYNFVKSHGPIIAENTLVSRMLSIPIHPWEDRLTLAVVKAFQEWMTGARTFYWDTLHYKRILEMAGYQCDPTLLEKLKYGWPHHSSIWPEWEQPVMRMLRIVAFRKEMINEIKKQDNPQ